MKTNTYAFAMMSFAMVVGSITEVRAQSEQAAGASRVKAVATCTALEASRTNSSIVIDGKTYNVSWSQSLAPGHAKLFKVSGSDNKELFAFQGTYSCKEQLKADAEKAIKAHISKPSAATNPLARTEEVKTIQTVPQTTQAVVAEEPKQTVETAKSGLTLEDVKKVVADALTKSIATVAVSSAQPSATTTTSSVGQSAAKTEQAVLKTEDNKKGTKATGPIVDEDRDDSDDESSDYASEKMRQCDEAAESAQNPKTDLFEKTNFSFPKTMPREARDKVYTSVFQIKCYAEIIKNAKKGIVESAKGKKLTSKERAELVSNTTQEVSQALRELTVELSKGESKSEQAIASIVVKNAKNKVVSKTFEGLKANAMLTGKIKGLQKFAAGWLTDLRNRFNQKSREATLYLSNCQLQASVQSAPVQQPGVVGTQVVQQAARSQAQCAQEVQQYMNTVNASFAQEAGRIYQDFAQQAGQISLARSLGNFMITSNKDGSVDYSNGGLTSEDIGVTINEMSQLQNLASKFLTQQQLQMGLGNIISEDDKQFVAALGLVQMDNANGAIQVNNQLPQIPGAPNVQVVQTPNGQPSQINTQLAGARTADRIAGQVQPLPQVAGGMNGMQGGQLGWNAGRGQMMNGQQFGNNRTQVWGGQPALQNNRFQQNQFQNNQFQQNQMQQPFIQQQQQMVGQQPQFQTVPQGTGLNTTLGNYQGVAPFPTVQQNNNLPIGLLS